MRKRCYLIVLLFLNWTVLSISQPSNNSRDSIFKVYQSATNDSLKFEALSKLCSELTFEDDEKALAYGMEAMQWEYTIKDPVRRGILHARLAQVYSSLGQIKKGLTENQLALSLFEEVKDYEKMAMIETAIGSIFYNTGNLSEADKHFQSSFSFSQIIKDTIGTAIALNNLGAVAQQKGELEKAGYFFEKSMELELLLGDYYSIAEGNVNLGNIDFGLGKYAKALERYSKAENYFQDIGETSHQWVLKINIAACNTKLGRFAEAVSILTGFPDSIKNSADFNTEEYYSQLAEAYNGQGQSHKALEIYQWLISWKDSVFAAEKEKNLTELQTKYETDKKESQIQLLRKNEEISLLVVSRQRTYIYMAIGGAVLFLLLSFLLYNRYKTKRNANLRLQVAYKQIEEKNKDITDSIHYARKIQSAILPLENDLKENLSDYFILFKPRDIVSGDFYWTARIDSFLFVCVADCTGHGVPGAFMSMIGTSLLNEIVKEKRIVATDKIIDLLREKIILSLKQKTESGETKDGMDLSFIRLDLITGKLNYTGANNNLWIIRNISKDQREIIELKADKMPVGLHERDQTPFSCHEFQLSADDRVYLFSDGYVDQFGGPKGKKFKSSRLKEELLLSADRSMDLQKKYLMDIFENWRGNLEQVDDVCIIGLEKK